MVWAGKGCEEQGPDPIYGGLLEVLHNFTPEASGNRRGSCIICSWTAGLLSLPSCAMMTLPTGRECRVDCNVCSSGI